MHLGCCLRRIVDFEAFFGPVTKRQLEVLRIRTRVVFCNPKWRSIRPTLEKAVEKTVSSQVLLPTIPSYRCPPREEGENSGRFEVVAVGTSFGVYVRANVRALCDESKPRPATPASLRSAAEAQKPRTWDIWDMSMAPERLLSGLDGGSGRS